MTLHALPQPDPVLTERARAGAATTAVIAALAADDLDEALAATAQYSRRQLVDALVAAALRLNGLEVTVRRQRAHLKAARTALTPGQVHGLRGPLGPRQLVEEFAWTDDELRAAHAAIKGGSVDARHRAGERIYQRLAKRARRREQVLAS